MCVIIHGCKKKKKKQSVNKNNEEYSNIQNSDKVENMHVKGVQQINGVKDVQKDAQNIAIVDVSPEDHSPKTCAQ